MGLTFWERMYIGPTRDAYRKRVWPAETIRAGLTNHLVTGGCNMIVAEKGAQADAAGSVAGEMSRLRARAAEVRGSDPTKKVRMAAIALALVVVGTTAERGVRHVRYAIERGKSWGGELAYELAIVLVAGLFAYFIVRYMNAQVVHWRRLCADLAIRLDGKTGLHGLDEVVHWLDTRWGWFLPPSFGDNDAYWAAGARRGVPVLVVLEHVTATALASYMTARSAGRASRTTHDRWHRTSVFLQGPRFQDAAHRQRVEATLARMGGGAVQCPSGVYLYGTYTFFGLCRLDGPTSEIWMDLVDQVIDPTFHGAPSAAKQLDEELAFMGLLPGGVPHA